MTLGARLSDQEGLAPSFGEVIKSVAILSGLVLLLPLALLAIGTPIALVLRAFVEIGRWVGARF